MTIIRYLQDLKEKKELDVSDISIKISTDGIQSMPISPNKPRTRKNWVLLKDVVKKEVHVRRSKRRVTKNTKQDFEKLNEIIHQRKLLWDDPDGINIDVSFRF